MMSGSYDILRLAGLISEVSDILMEVDFSKGDKVKVTWTKGYRGDLTGSISGNNEYSGLWKKKVVPERGRDWNCCLLHNDQDGVIKFDTNVGNKGLGSLVIDPLDCKDCGDLHDLIPSDFEYKVKDDVLFLRYRGDEKKVDKSGIIYGKFNDKVKEVIDEIKNSGEFEDNVKKLRSGEISLPSYPGILMKPSYIMQPRVWPESYVDYNFRLGGKDYSINFVRKIVGGVRDPDYRVNDDLVINQVIKVSGSSGGSVLSGDERGYRSDGFETSHVIGVMGFEDWKESILDDIDSGLLSRDEFLDKVKDIEDLRDSMDKIVSDYDKYKDYLLKYSLFETDFRKWVDSLSESEKRLFRKNRYGSDSPASLFLGYSLPV